MTPISFACTAAGSGGGVVGDTDGDAEVAVDPVGVAAVRGAALPPQAATTAPTAKENS